MNQALKYLLYSQASFLIFIAICFVLQPDAFLNNVALSYYGTNTATFVPYATGILLASFFLLKSASRLQKGGKVLRLSMRAMAGLLVAMLFVPYSVSKTFSDIHLALAGLLLLVVLIASIYIIVTIDRKPLNLAIVLLELIAVMLLYFSLFGKLHMHGASELLINLLFISLMYNTLKDVKEHRLQNSGANAL